MIALLDRLKEHLPFSLLSSDEQQSIEASAQIAYYPEGELLIASQAKPELLFYIIKGVVEARDGEELIDIYHQDDTFGGIELIKEIGAKYDYIVSQELICYEIPHRLFLKLCQNNSEFKNYFFSSIVERMEMLKERRESAKMANMMVARVDSSIYHPACIVDSSLSVIDALRSMEQKNSSSILIKNRSGYGIVTDADLRKYILYPDRDSYTKIADIQTYPIITVAEGELLFNVLLMMTGHSIKHLPVVDAQGNPVGMLELIDLLSHFANQSHIVSVQIERASDLKAVIDASRRIDVMIKTLHLKGVKSRYIAKLVSELHKKMYSKLFELIFPESWHKHCTLVLLGSEGRGEQILRTDQDNALIFEDGFEPEDKEEIATRFIEALDKIGFPRCQGNVMVINPKWAKDQKSYKKDIDNWINLADYEGFMDLAIFYDAFGVAGNISIFLELRKYLLDSVAKQQEFLPHFAKSIDSFEAPLGIFSRFISSNHGHKDEIDIKKGALFALIHGIRSLSLEYGIHKTNTTQRIKALNGVGYFTKEDASNLIETLEILNTLRLHSQLEQLESKEEIDNYILLSTLNKLEKDILKDALQTVERFKKRVAYHFHFSMVS